MTKPCCNGHCLQGDACPLRTQRAAFLSRRADSALQFLIWFVGCCTIISIALAVIGY